MSEKKLTWCKYNLNWMHFKDILFFKSIFFGWHFLTDRLFNFLDGSLWQYLWCKVSFPFAFVYAYRYVCLGGSSSPMPSDSSHGYLCPAGHSCPVGSAVEVPCEPGTYSPAPGAAYCIICPEGTMCSSSATRETSICPAGEGGEINFECRV